MARSQTWTRNLNKKVKKPILSRAIVNDDALEGLKRRAEDLGLIIHARTPKLKPGSKKGKGRR